MGSIALLTNSVLHALKLADMPVQYSSLAYCMAFPNIDIMKKILFAIRQGKVGGGERHLLDLVTNLNKNEFIPVVLSFTPGEMVDTLKVLNIKTYVIETDNAYNFRVWKKVKELIRQEKINIVHAHGSRAATNVFWATKTLKLPLIYTVHGWSFHAGQKIYIQTIRQWVEYWLVRGADVVINVSMNNWLEGRKKLNMNNATVVYNGVDLTTFTNNNNIQDIRAELNISGSVTLVGYIARITEQKDPITFVCAAEIILKQYKDIHFLIVGDGNLKPNVVNLVNKLQLNSNIHFQNFRTDIPVILKTIDIYCLPSLWEGFSIGLLEAMAMGKAVITTFVDGNKEIILDGVNGLIIAQKNPDDLAQKIISLHNNQSLREKLGKHAKELVHREFSLQNMVEKVEELYNTMNQKG